jgi:hypothetical protein
VRRRRDRRDGADAGDDQAAPDAGDGPQRMDRSTLPPVPASSGARPGAAGRWPVPADDEDDLDWGRTFRAEDEPAFEEGTGRSARRRLALIGLPLLALLMVVAVAIWFGKNVLSVAGSVDEVKGSTPSASAPVSSAGAPAPPAAAGAPVAIADASVFDPYGDGATENDASVPRTHDGDPATSWSTVAYRGSAQFGKLKPGVGVLFDLGSPQALAGVTIVTQLPGTTVEVRTGAAPDGDLARFPVAAGGTLTGTDQLAFRAPVTARYLLIWVTGLVAGDGGFSGGFAEVTPLAATG